MTLHADIRKLWLMVSKPARARTPGLTLLAVVLMCCADSAAGGTATWNVEGNPVAWTNTANWLPNTTFPNGVGDIAYVTKGLASNVKIDLNIGITLGELNIRNGSTAGVGYTIQPGTPAGSLIFDTGSAANAVLTRVNSLSSGGDSVSANIALNKDLDITASGGNAELRLSGIISDGTASHAVAKYGGGTLNLTGLNTFTGGLTLNAGTISVTTAQSLGSGTGQLTLAGGTTLSLVNNTILNMGRNTWVTGNATIALTGRMPVRSRIRSTTCTSGPIR